MHRPPLPLTGGGSCRSADPRCRLARLHVNQVQSFPHSFDFLYQAGWVKERPGWGVIGQTLRQLPSGVGHWFSPEQLCRFQSGLWNPPNPRFGKKLPTPLYEWNDALIGESRGCPPAPWRAFGDSLLAKVMPVCEVSLIPPNHESLVYFKYSACIILLITTGGNRCSEASWRIHSLISTR